MCKLMRLVLLIGLLGVAGVQALASETVVVLEIKGGIGVATADYVSSGIQAAETGGAELVIIEMDTPGGLMGPTRDIVQDILGSTVPVVAYVTPLALAPTVPEPTFCLRVTSQR